MSLRDLPGQTALAVPQGQAIYRHDIKHPFKVKGGYIDLPTGPGLGIELDEAAMKAGDKYGHDWKNQEAYDADDGSVVDW